ncbi:MAG: SDR family oxidoreductase [Spirochaetales bacterium]|nr:SDR family oxidoreductase [Spirochaetales bacterium]
MAEKTNRNTVVLVTGATSGIGKAIAAALASAGYLVIGTGRRARPSDLPETIYYEIMDVTDDASVAEAVQNITSTYGSPEICVACAGAGIAGAVEDTPLQEAKAQFEVNFFGAVRVVQAVLPLMRARNTGRIILIGSLAGRTGMPFQAFYSASKFALEGLVESLRHEVRPYGIEVCLLEPGDFKTGFTGARRKLAREGSPYLARFSTTLAIQEHDEQHGADPFAAGVAVLRLLRMRKLPLRVSVGPLFQRAAIGMRRLLPDAWFEAVYRIYYRL